MSADALTPQEVAELATMAEYADPEELTGFWRSTIARLCAEVGALTAARDEAERGIGPDLRKRIVAAIPSAAIASSLSVAVNVALGEVERLRAALLAAEQRAQSLVELAITEFEVLAEANPANKAAADYYKSRLALASSGRPAGAPEA